MEEQKNTKNVKLKNAIIVILLIIFLFISLFYIGYYLNTKFTFISNTPVDYQALCSLQASNKLQFSICSVEYNLENYSLEFYANKYSKNFTYQEKFVEENLNNDILEIIHMDFNQPQEEPNNNYICSYYFINIKENNLIIVIYVYYNDNEIYQEYEEVITDLIINIEIPSSNNLNYENLFTDMLTFINFPSEEDMLNYKSIANQDSSYVKAYENLTANQKKCYDILFEKLFINKENYSVTGSFGSEIMVDYSAGLEALKCDLIYLGFEHYTILTDFKWDENIQSDVCIFYTEYTNDITLYHYDLKYGYTTSDYVTLTDEELEIFNSNINRIINSMPKNLSTLGKYKYLADSICEICEYDYEGLENEKLKPNTRIHSMIGVFVDGKAVCDGYTYAYYYLCTKLNLDCHYFVGFSADLSFSHAFNYIKLGEKYYFVDTTWLDGDNSFSNFAFTYGIIENAHDEYIEDWFKVDDLPKYSPFNNLMKNLGTLDWSIKTIF